MAMAYGDVYVAQVAFGAKDAQTVRAFLEAEAYPGPSIIIAYSHCIAHGYDMAHGLDQQKLAVDTGYWPLYRFDPTADARRREPGSSSTRPRPRSSSASTCATRRASAWSNSRTRSASATCSSARRTTSRRRFALYEELARGTTPAEAQVTSGGPSGRGADRRTTMSGAPARAPARSPDGPHRPDTSASTCAHPLMTGASPLVDRLDLVKRLEDAGASAITMHSLFEEQIAMEQRATIHHMESARRVLRRGALLLPEPRGLQPRARRVPRADPPHQGDGGRAGDRLAERLDRPRLDRLRAR